MSHLRYHVKFELGSRRVGHTPHTERPEMSTTPGAFGIGRLEPIANLRDRVEKAIAAAIISGQMPPGAVCSVPTLAAQFEVSATPVREAMLNLEKRGFVKTLRNKGYRVTDVDAEKLAQLVAVRQLLEPEALAQVAVAFTPEKCGQAWDLADRIVAGAEARDLDAYLAADHAFHLLLLAQLGNPVLVEIVSDVRERTRLVGLRNLLGTERLSRSAAEHHELLDLLQTHDADGVRALMRRHIGHIAGWWSGHEETVEQ